MSDLNVDGMESLPENKGKVTLTSRHNGKEYGGKIVNTKETFCKLSSETVFADITLKSSANITFVCNFNPVVFDDGFKTELSDKKNVRIVGGFYSPTSEQLAITNLDTNITINNGEFYLVIGLSKKKGMGIMYHTGTSNITVNGGKVDILNAGTHENHAGMDVVVNINGGEVNKLRCAGDVSRRLYGDATVNLIGGKVSTLEVNNVLKNTYLNVVGCAPEKVSVSYYNNEIKETAQKNKATTHVSYNSLVCSDAIIKQFTELFDVVENTTCIYVTANGKGDGSSQSSAMGSIAAAYAKLREDGGRIIVSGEVKWDLTARTQNEHKGEIIISGQDDGASVHFDKAAKNCIESETTFDNITLASNGNATLYACYNKLTLGKSVKTKGDISVVGSGEGTKVGDVQLILNGGELKNVSALGSDAATDKIGAYITLGGAVVDKVTLSEKNAEYGYGAISVSGGKIKEMNTVESGSFGEMSVKVLGGEIEKLTLSGAKNSLFFNVSHAVFGSNIKAGNIPLKENCALIVGSDVDESKLADIKDKFGETKNGNIIYLADGGTGNGISPDAPMGDLNAAIKALGGEGSVVVVGTYTIKERMAIDAHEYPVVITSIGTDRDYRNTGAAIVFEKTLLLGGETTFEKINLSTGVTNLYIYGMSHKLVIGEEVNTTLTADGISYISIIGGRDDKLLAGSVDVTVKSGDWGIFRAGSNETGAYNNDLKINVTIDGGVFHKYVALGARGQITGTINCTINNGRFYQGVYVVYEEDGKHHKLNYDATLTINGGEFYQMVAPAKSRSTTINGKYNLYLNGGDFSSCTDVAGSELYAGYMSSYIHIGEGVDVNKKETGDKTFKNPLDPNAPDPWLFYHDGYYYYTHTTGTKIILTKATNVGDITTSAETVVISPTEGEDMWSPEIHYFSEEEVGEANEGWYLYIAYDHGESGTRRAHVLKCKNGDDFFGEWVNPITGETNKPEKIVFPDFPELDTIGTNGGYSKLVVNGKTYMTFIRSVNRGTPEYHQKLCIAEIDTPWSYKGVPVTLTVSEYDWECHGYGQNQATGGWYPKVIEGASAVYGDNGEVYIMYTGSGYWTKYYALGFLRYMGGDPLDAASWKKNPEPVLSLNDEVNGCGHGSYYKDHNGDYYVAYHGYVGKDTSGGRYCFVERIYVTADRVYIGNDTGHPAPLSTVYTVSANPMPLANKIGGFTEKIDQSNKNPFENIQKPSKDTEADTTQVDSQSGGGVSPTVAIVIIVIAVVVVAGGVVLYAVKGNKKTPEKKSEEE